MHFLTKNKSFDDFSLFAKICFDTLIEDITPKIKSELFCGIYIDGRNREINSVEDFAALHSFKTFSEYDYPYLVLSPNSNNLFNNDSKYKQIHHIEIPECNSHESYSQFVIKNIWNFIPKHFKRLLFVQSDGFLIKRGWEQYVLDTKVDYIGSAWCHGPGIDCLFQNKWVAINYPKIQCGNGGFSYRNRDICERISNTFSSLILKEHGCENEKPPPEDLFYSHLMNGWENGGIVASVEQCMKFSFDPITLKEYNNKYSFGFHYPKKVNQFHHHRDFYLNLK